MMGGSFCEARVLCYASSKGWQGWVALIISTLILIETGLVFPNDGVEVLICVL